MAPKNRRSHPGQVWIGPATLLLKLLIEIFKN